MVLHRLFSRAKCVTIYAKVNTMDYVILAIAVVVLNLVFSCALLVAFINFGVFPRPEPGDLAIKLYWRTDFAVEFLSQTATAASVHVAPAEWPRSTSGTVRAVFTGRSARRTSLYVVPDVTNTTAAGDKVLVMTA